MDKRDIEQEQDRDLDLDLDPDEDLDPYETLGESLQADLLGRQREDHRRGRMRPGHKPKQTREAILSGIADPEEALDAGFETTYKPSEHERGWLFQALRGFYLQGEITDILRMIKGGKEACVYQCVAGPGLGREFLAAKVYRPRRFRNLRNDAVYRHGRRSLDAEGKELRDDRAQRAIFKGTDRGKSLAHTSWLAHELEAMRLLHEAGADVPEPFDGSENVILMEYIGDAETPAPALNHIELAPDEADPLFRRILHNVEIMLGLSMVHGDLSAYNILYDGGRIVLIDFPQVIDPFTNPHARRIFNRDIKRLCQYFASQGIAGDPVETAERLWRKGVEHDPWVDPANLHAELSMLAYRAENRDEEYDDEEDD